MNNTSDQNDAKNNDGSNAKMLPDLYTRGQLERLIELKQLLLMGKFPNTPELAEKLKVSERTVGRTIEFMRDRLDIPVVFDTEKGGYHFTGPVGQFPGEKPSDAEVAGAVLALQWMESFQGMMWHGLVQNILQGYLAQVEGPQKELTKNLMPSVYFQEPEVTEDTDPQLFELLMNGLCNDQVVYFDYRKPLDIYRPRVIEPYVMTSWENCWYVLGRDRVSNKIRTFKLYRMRNARLSAQTFVMPPNFDPKQYYKKSIGMFVSDGDHEVVVQLSPWLTDVLEGPRYRAWKSWEKKPDGSSIVTMQLSCLEEVQRWVLGWGKNIRAIKPRILWESIYQEALKVVAMYEDGMEEGAGSRKASASAFAYSI